MMRLIEIRSYKLKAGSAAQFHSTAASTVVPMLREWEMDVVAFGPSAHEPDTYFLIRAYDDLTVLWLSPESIEDLRRSNVHAAAGVRNDEA